MKVLVVCLLLALIMSASAIKNVPKPTESSQYQAKSSEEKNILDFVLGLLMALNTLTDVPDSLQCALDHSSDFSKIFKTIEADVKSFDMIKIYGEFKDFFAIFHSGSCKSFTTEADKYFGNILTQLTNPIDIYKGDMRIAAQRSQVNEDWKTFFSSYKSQNYYMAGLSMGEPLAIYLGFQ